MEWLSVAQTGDRIGLGEDAVLDRIKSGEIAASNIALPGAARPRWRVSTDSIATYMQRRQYQPRRRRQASGGAVAAVLALLVLLAGCSGGGGDAECAGIHADVVLWTNELAKAGTASGRETATAELAEAQQAWREAGCDGGSA